MKKFELIVGSNVIIVVYAVDRERRCVAGVVTIIAGTICTIPLTIGTAVVTTSVLIAVATMEVTGININIIIFAIIVFGFADGTAVITSSRRLYLRHDGFPLHRRF